MMVNITNQIGVIKIAIKVTLLVISNINTKIKNINVIHAIGTPPGNLKFDVLLSSGANFLYLIYAIVINDQTTKNSTVDTDVTYLKTSPASLII